MEFKNTKQKLTNEEFNEFVNNNDLELPITYKNHMMIFNGGKPVLNYFEVQSFSHISPNLRSRD